MAKILLLRFVFFLLAGKKLSQKTANGGRRRRSAKERAREKTNRPSIKTMYDDVCNVQNIDKFLALERGGGERKVAGNHK